LPTESARAIVRFARTFAGRPPHSQQSAPKHRPTSALSQLNRLDQLSSTLFDDLLNYFVSFACFVVKDPSEQC
jgi:hypothetical protein